MFVSASKFRTRNLSGSPVFRNISKFNIYLDCHDGVPSRKDRPNFGVEVSKEFRKFIGQKHKKCYNKKRKKYLKYL